MIWFTGGGKIEYVAVETVFSEAEYIVKIMARRPFLWLALCMAGGIVSCWSADMVGANYSTYATVVLLCALGVFAAGFWRLLPASEGVFSRCSGVGRYPSGYLMTSLGLVSMAAGIMNLGAVERRLDLGVELLRHDRQVSMVFEILHMPQAGLAEDDSRFWKTGVRVLLYAGKPVTQDVCMLLYGNSAASELRRGDIYRGQVAIYTDYPQAYPGAFSYRDYLRQNGFCARGKLKGEAFLVKKAQGVAVLWQWLERVRADAVQRTLRLLPDQRGAFLAAAMFGYKLDLQNGLREDFRKIGIGHVLAISGLHVGLVVGLFWFGGSLLIRKRRVVAGICIVACLAYLSLCGGRTAALRAGIIALVYLGGILLGRRSDFLNSLGVAAFLILLMNPWQFFSLGFQLSFMAVIFISCLGRELAHLLPLRQQMEQQEFSVKRVVKTWGLGLAAMSVCAWLGVLPLSAMTFMEVSFSGLGLNIIAVPLMSLALGGGIVLQFAGLLPEWLAVYVADILALPAKGLILLADYTTVIPGGGVEAFRPPVWLLIVYYVVFGVFLGRRVLIQQIAALAWKKRIAWITAALSAVSVGMMLCWCFGPAATVPEQTVVLGGGSGELAVTFKKDGRVFASGWLPREGKNLRAFLLGMRVRRLDELRLCDPPEEKLLRENLSGLSPCRLIAPVQDKGDKYKFSFAEAEGYRVWGDWNAKKRIQWITVGTGQGIVRMTGWVWPSVLRHMKTIVKVYKDVTREVDNADGAVGVVFFLKLKGKKRFDVAQLVWATMRCPVFVSGAATGGIERNHWGAVKLIDHTLYGYNGEEWLRIAPEQFVQGRRIER